MEGYPRAGTVLNVITDDGWRFNAKLVAKTIKIFVRKMTLNSRKVDQGRLEAAGILEVGKPITEQMLQNTGGAILTYQNQRPRNLAFGFSV